MLSEKHFKILRSEFGSNNICPYLCTPLNKTGSSLKATATHKRKNLLKRFGGLKKIVTFATR